MLRKRNGSGCSLLTALLISTRFKISRKEQSLTVNPARITGIVCIRNWIRTSFYPRESIEIPNSSWLHETPKRQDCTKTVPRSVADNVFDDAEFQTWVVIRGVPSHCRKKTRNDNDIQRCGRHRSIDHHCPPCSRDRGKASCVPRYRNERVDRSSIKSHSREEIVPNLASLHERLHHAAEEVICHEYQESLPTPSNQNVPGNVNDLDLREVIAPALGWIAGGAPTAVLGVWANEGDRNREEPTCVPLKATENALAFLHKTKALLASYSRWMSCME